MVLDSSSQIETKSISLDTLVSSTTAVKANIDFEITSKALDFEALRLQLGADYSQAPINASFRY